MDVLKEVSAPAQRVYATMVEVAEKDGVCRANQRQLVALLGIAFKTLIPARDELVARGLVRRILHYRGKRDWYKIVPTTKVERTREAARRLEARQVRAQRARAEVQAQLALGLEVY